MSKLMEPETSNPEQGLMQPRNNETGLLKLQRPVRINQGRSFENIIHTEKPDILLI